MSAITTEGGTTMVVGEEEAKAKAAHKRYEGLLMVRNKAIRGKGAWFWHHLEPLLHNSDNDLPKAVKLKCCLCHSLFSASNPSRTASEHLKKGTCPCFNSSNHPIKSPPKHWKRSSSSSDDRGGANVGPTSYAFPISVIEPSPKQQLLALPSSSCVKDELMKAKYLFEDSIKRLKSPKASPVPPLPKSQIDSALDLLGEWLYESCGSVSFSSLEHPKFKSFLHQVGMPEVCRKDFCGSRLDSRFDYVSNDCEVRIKNAEFFQLESHEWKCEVSEENLIHLTVNLPGGSSIYQGVIFTGGKIPSKYAEEVLWETVVDICGDSLHKCVGIVSDKFKTSALRNLESQNKWMINLPCQYKACRSLIKHFYKELSLFKNVTEICLKLANFVNNTGPVRTCFHKYQLSEYGHAGLIRTPTEDNEMLDFKRVHAMIEDVMSSARVLQLVTADESYRTLSVDDLDAQEFGEMIRNVGFWNDIEAVRSLVKLVTEMAGEFEIESPLVGQCLQLWEQLRVKVKDWCGKFHIVKTHVDEVIQAQFSKNYHPAWSAAYILDPMYMIRDSNGKFLPPFKHLTPDQVKDVDTLITRLVPQEEVHVALMELMKWRTEGLDPVYAQAVQLKERDPSSGKMRIANPHGSRLVWESYLPEFKSLPKVAIRLIFLHATTCGFEFDQNVVKWVQSNGRSRYVMDKVQKMMFISAQSRLDRRDFSSDCDKDAAILACVNGENGVVNQVFL